MYYVPMYQNMYHVPENATQTNLLRKENGTIPKAACRRIAVTPHGRPTRRPADATRRAAVVPLSICQESLRVAQRKKSSRGRRNEQNAENVRKQRVRGRGGGGIGKGGGRAGEDEEESIIVISLKNNQKGPEDLADLDVLRN